MLILSFFTNILETEVTVTVMEKKVIETEACASRLRVKSYLRVDRINNDSETLAY